MTTQRGSCRFCRFAADGGEALVDVPLAESRSFIVLPSLGSLVEGWLLVVPRRHILSTAELTPSERAELLPLVSRVTDQLERTYEAAVWRFEHGATAEMQAIGCGVNHAHLHLVPLPFDLAEQIRAYPSRLEFVSVDPNSDLDGSIVGGQSFVFVSDGHTGMVARDAAGESQFVRRVVAQAVGRPLEWDWKQHPQLDVAFSTHRTLTATCHRDLATA